MAERVIVHEVGLRDGLQNQPRMVPVEGKLELLDALIAAGVRSVEATSFVSPKAVPQMADAAELYARIPKRADMNYEVLVPNEKGYERAVAAGARTIAVVIAASDTFNRRNINMSLDEATLVCEAVVRRTKREGHRSRAYISALAACPYEGVTPPERVFDLTAKMFDAGADEVALSDTIGAGNPAQIEYLFESAIRRHGAQRIAAHFHDTRAMGLTLAWCAIKAGVRKLDSSIGGLGGCPFAPGASGNLATEDLVFMLNEAGYETGIDVEGLRRAVMIAERLTGQSFGGRMTNFFRAQDARRQAKAKAS
ncbi:MAG: hydroxymethylglutaryl-CoA lyase [Alphaproteobacteria bacterium]|nr:hydroxymethylglutaryl-CoA lyase [Alphaproteobacteria bacterium]